MNKEFLRKLTPVMIVAAIVAVIPVIIGFDEYILDLLTKTGLCIVLVTSLRLSFLAGLFNVAQTGFYAIGAYGMYLFLTRSGIPFWGALPLVGLAAGAIAWGLGSAILRAKGIYFALVTMAFVEVIRLTVVHTIGSLKCAVFVPQPNPIVIPYLTTIDFTNMVDYYYPMLGLVAITLFFLYRLEKSPIAEIFKAIEKSPALSESVGINVTRYQNLAFTIGAFFAGMAGGFFACSNTVIAPAGFTLWDSIMLWFFMIVGGLDSFWGPVVGAILLSILPTFLPSGTPQMIFFSILAIVILFSLPGGVVSLPEVIRATHWRRGGVRKSGG